jgi:hypothetical protein
MKALANQMLPSFRCRTAGSFERIRSREAAKY